MRGQVGKFKYDPRECCASGGKTASTSLKGRNVQQGKPDDLFSEEVRRLQGGWMGQRVGDVGKSEGRFVMRRIGIESQTMPMQDDKERQV